jgi:hypothetical protein
VRLFYSPEYLCGAHSFDTTRKSGWIAASLTSRPMWGVEMLGCEPSTRAGRRPGGRQGYVVPVAYVRPIGADIHPDSVMRMCPRVTALVALSITS